MIRVSTIPCIFFSFLLLILNIERGKGEVDNVIGHLGSSNALELCAGRVHLSLAQKLSSSSSFSSFLSFCLLSALALERCAGHKH